MPVIVNRASPGITLQHKSIASSCHFVKEYCYGDVAEIRKIGDGDNVLDALTKGLDSSGFNNCMMLLMSN